MLCVLPTIKINYSSCRTLFYENVMYIYVLRKFVSSPERPHWGQPTFQFSAYQVSPGVKRSEREADHSPSSVELNIGGAIPLPPVGRDSSGGIATGYGLDGPKIESQWG
jgi:hypothetical protein